MISQLTSLFNLQDTIHDNYVYIYNNKGLDKKITEKMKKNAAYYEFRYIEFEEEYRLVLYTNKKGLEVGVPYLEQSKAFLNFNNVEIQEKVVLTSKIEYANSEVHFTPFFDSFVLENYFFNINYQLDYLYVDDDYFIIEQKYDLLVITEDTSSLLSSFYDTGFKENSFVADGEMVKSNALATYKTEIMFLVILSFIPFFLSAFALRNIYVYYISKNKEEIIISFIYYKTEKKIIQKYCCEIFLMASIPSFLALVIAYLVNGSTYFPAFIISLFVIMLFEILTIRRNTKKEVKKYCLNNEWRGI